MRECSRAREWSEEQTIQAMEELLMQEGHGQSRALSKKYANAP
jgi:hypothetical protein